jgi:dihydroneopterin aldolase
MSQNAYPETPNQTVVTVRDMRIPAYVGVYEHEHGVQQEVIINVDVGLSEWQIVSDQIASTISYEPIVLEIRRLASIHHDLVESFADCIARFCLSDERVSYAKVSVEKPEVWKDCRVGVTVTRYQGSQF